MSTSASSRALVLIATQHLSKSLDYHSVVKALRQLPSGLLVRSLLATALSYLALVGRDAVALCSELDSKVLALRASPKP